MQSTYIVLIHHISYYSSKFSHLLFKMLEWIQWIFCYWFYVRLGCTSCHFHVCVYFQPPFLYYLHFACFYLMFLVCIGLFECIGCVTSCSTIYLYYFSFTLREENKKNNNKRYFYGIYSRDGISWMWLFHDDLMH